MRKLALHWQILIAIMLAIVVGYTINQFTTDAGAPSLFGIGYVTIFNYIGTMFLNALRMIIVPLITSSIIIGVAGIGSGGDLGALGGKTLLFYATTTLAAISHTREREIRPAPPSSKSGTIGRSAGICRLIRSVVGQS